MYCSTTVIFCGIFLLIPDQWKKFGTSFVKRHVTVYLSMCFFISLHFSLVVSVLTICSRSSDQDSQSLPWSILVVGHSPYRPPGSETQLPAQGVLWWQQQQQQQRQPQQQPGKKKHENHHWMFSTHLEFIWVKMSLFLPQSLESKNWEKSVSKHQFSNPPTIHHFSPHLKSPCTLRWAFA